jgi:hypothetical protein
VSTVLEQALALIVTPEAETTIRQAVWLLGLIGALLAVLRRARKQLATMIEDIVASRAVSPEALAAAVEIAVERAVQRRLKEIESRQLGIESMVRALLPDDGRSLAETLDRIESAVGRVEHHQDHPDDPPKETQ